MTSDRCDDGALDEHVGPRWQRRPGCHVAADQARGLREGDRGGCLDQGAHGPGELGQEVGGPTCREPDALTGASQSLSLNKDAQTIGN